MGNEGWFAERRRIKREIVRMNTPWIDRFKDWAFRVTILILLVFVLIMVIRGHNNGAW